MNTELAQTLSILFSFFTSFSDTLGKGNNLKFLHRSVFVFPLSSIVLEVNRKPTIFFQCILNIEHHGFG